MPARVPQQSRAVHVEAAEWLPGMIAEIGSLGHQFTLESANVNRFDSSPLRTARTAARSEAKRNHQRRVAGLALPTKQRTSIHSANLAIDSAYVGRRPASTSSFRSR